MNIAITKYLKMKLFRSQFNMFNVFNKYIYQVLVCSRSLEIHHNES